MSIIFRTHRARKAHDCIYCGGPIKQGQRYQCCVVFCPDVIRSDRNHFGCPHDEEPGESPIWSPPGPAREIGIEEFNSTLALEIVRQIEAARLLRTYGPILVP